MEGASPEGLLQVPGMARIKSADGGLPHLLGVPDVNDESICPNGTGGDCLHVALCALRLVNDLNVIVVVQRVATSVHGDLADRGDGDRRVDEFPHPAYGPRRLSPEGTLRELGLLVSRAERSVCEE